MNEKQKFVTEQIRNLELINRVDRKSFLDLLINEFRSKFIGFLKCRKSSRCLHFFYGG